MSNYTLTDEQQEIALDCAALLKDEAAALGCPDIEWSVRGAVHLALETLREKTMADSQADRLTRADPGNGWSLEESRHYTSPGKYGIKLVKSRDGEGMVFRAIVFRNWSPEFRTQTAAHSWAHRFFDSCEKGTA